MSDILDAMPHDITGKLDQYVIKNGSVWAYVRDLVWHASDRRLVFARLLSGTRDGGIQTVEHLFFHMVGGQTCSTNILIRRDNWDYNTNRRFERLSNEVAHLGFEQYKRGRKAYKLQHVPVRNYRFVESAIVDTESWLGAMQRHFDMIVPAEWEREERLALFYDQFAYRCQSLPIRKEWTRDIWQHLVEKGRINLLPSYGHFVGWQIEIDEPLLRAFARQQIVTRSFYLPFTPEALPVAA